MKITNFEDTGLENVNDYLLQNKIGAVSFLNSVEKTTLRELLKPFNVSFVLENANRLQSTLLCELDLSYVQQSQRYVELQQSFELPLPDESENISYNKTKELIKKTFELYEKMSEKKGEIKGRPKAEDYKHGIPIEDARYILPLACNTNIILAFNASKLIDIFELINDDEYIYLFRDLYFDLKGLLPEELGNLLIKCCPEKPIININRFYAPFFSYVDPVNPVQVVNEFGDNYEKAALGAWCSSQKLTSSEIQEKYKDNFDEKALGIMKRVIGYGHTAIIEQRRTTFVSEMSLTAYHQFIRHRLTVKNRQPLSDLINYSHNFIIPETIRNSDFAVDYVNLIKEIVSERKKLPKKYQYLLLLNCESIKTIFSSNARIDVQNIKERMCLTAQWEIRRLYTEMFKLMYAVYPEIYKFALPPCVEGKPCKEGRMTCGKPQELKNALKDIL